MPQILQMKLTGNVELAVVAALIGVIAFMPRVFSAIVSSQVGKAIAFGAVAYLWKQHNELIALLLAIAFLKAAPSYEYADDLGKPDDKAKDKSDPKPKMTGATGAA